MRLKPRHLMISGLGDADDHRMSARDRGEKYVHIQDTSAVPASLPYDIVYVDSTSANRAEDVVSERLQWVSEMAGRHPSTLFVVVGERGWAGQLAAWPGRDLPNIYFQTLSPTRHADEAFDMREILAGPVRAWEKLATERNRRGAANRT
jgi:hypothetical protein